MPGKVNMAQKLKCNLCDTDIGSRKVVTPDIPVLGNRQVGVSLDFEMDRIPQDTYNKSFFLMSFDEQWSGYKAKAAAVD
jgi:hypothetical protein